MPTFIFSFIFSALNGVYWGGYLLRERNHDNIQTWRKVSTTKNYVDPLWHKADVRSLTLTHVKLKSLD